MDQTCSDRESHRACAGVGCASSPLDDIGAGRELLTERSQWLILTALKRGDHTMQRDIATAIGIEGATLTHHLNRMETDGLVRRERVAGNRRTQVVTLTPAGEALFARLLRAVVAFDQQLCAGFSEH